MAPRSTVVLAPISTSSWMTTRPICGIALRPLGAGDKAEAVLADPGAAMDDDPIADQRVLDAGTRADIAVAADLAGLADDRVGRDDGAAADRDAAAR